MEDLTEELRAELEKLKNEYTDNDSKQAALKIAGDSPATPIETRSTEGREFRALVNGGNVGEIFDAAIGKRAVSGATAELQQHKGLDANVVPLALLVRDWPGNDELETRAVTPAPGDVAQNQQSIIPYVFPQSAATFLGVDMPEVGTGEAVFPVLTSELAVGTPAENAAIKPRRRARSPQTYFRRLGFRRRSSTAGKTAQGSPVWTPRFRENLSAGLADGLDDQVLTNTNGLFTGTILANNNVSAITAFADYISEMAYGRVEGRYASTASDVRAFSWAREPMPTPGASTAATSS